MLYYTFIILKSNFFFKNHQLQPTVVDWWLLFGWISLLQIMLQMLNLLLVQLQ